MKMNRWINEWKLLSKSMNVTVWMNKELIEHLKDFF